VSSITQVFLKQFFDYNPQTGQLIWKEKYDKNIRIGSVAGQVEHGHRIIKLNGHPYRVAYLIWIYHKGIRPNGEVAYKDKNPLRTHVGNLIEILPKADFSFEKEFFKRKIKLWLNQVQA
jgi:hypothetical protein